MSILTIFIATALVVNHQVAHAVVPECQTGSVDVALVLDVSKSITDHGMSIIATAIQGIVEDLDIDEGKNRVAVITFACYAYVKATMGQYATSKAFASAVNTLVTRPSDNYGCTATNLGFDSAAAQLTPSGVKRVILLITDGRSTTEASTEATAKKLLASGIIILCIGVHTSFSTSQLAALTHYPVMTTKNYEELLTIIDDITKQICVVQPFSVSSVSASNVKCKAICLKNGVAEYGGMKRKVGSTVTLKCDPGYSPTGSSSATCQAGGTWTNAITKSRCARTKTCASAVSIAGGKVTAKAGFEANQKIDYKCDEGRELSGSYTDNECVAGAWKHPKPVCTKTACRIIKLFRNGHISKPDGYKDGAIIEFTCDPGYKLKGAKTMECRKGVWIGTKPQCKSTRCRTDNRGILNGQASPKTNAQNQEVLVFECFQGYALDGPKEVTCLENRKWSACFPTCRSNMCTNYVHIRNGRFQKDDPELPTTLTTICDEGFKLYGSETLKCVGGKWDDALPECRDTRCREMKIVSYGKLINYSNRDGAIIKLECNPGYKPVANKDTATCVLRDWSYNLRCERDRNQVLPTEKKCPFVTANHCTINGNTLTCNCRNTVTTIPCANGVWSRAVPECPVLKCNPIKSLTDGYVIGGSYEIGSTLTYKCRQGYTLKGADSATCEQNSAMKDPIWTASKPVCLLSCCINLQRLEHGIVKGTGIMEGATRTMECKPGYKRVGPSSITCSKGSWDPYTPTTCIKNTCPKIDGVDNGRLEGSGRQHGDEMMVICNSGYECSASSKRMRCKPNGNWDHMPRCRKIKCPPKYLIPNGKALTYSEMPGQAMKVECNPGYEVATRKEIKCYGPRGYWSSLTPLCEPVLKCQTICLRNGEVIATQKDNERNIDYAYVCDEGYSIRGPEKVKCRSAIMPTTQTECIPNIPDECRSQRQDVIIIVELDRYVGETKRKRLYEFLLTVLKHLHEDYTRIAIIGYAEEAVVIQDLEQVTSEDIINLQKTLMTWGKSIKGRQLAPAIMKAGELARSSSRATSVINVIFAKPIDMEDTKTAAAAMRNMEVEHFVFGIGNNVQYPATPEVLREIAGDAGDDRSQHEDIVTHLTLQMREIAARICRSVKTTATAA